MDEEKLVLDTLTGLVHEYVGPGLGQPLSCGCSKIQQSHEADRTVIITRDYYERGIWEAAPCMEDDS